MNATLLITTLENMTPLELGALYVAIMFHDLAFALRVRQALDNLIGEKEAGQLIENFKAVRES